MSKQCGASNQLEILEMNDGDVLVASYWIFDHKGLSVAVSEGARMENLMNSRNFLQSGE
jgi:hypothetical protein